ncbi:MAG TPA: ABC transporter permease [Candidatus Mucispirillum faecigallinarum]|uniref:ABC transporter permease n=1 Tax=Candidatus Mucispirillum faecigallinarum TaxID=2838699 RepID=A0A9D2KC86_9BACT|nr:ABC transporter permease [Candidatus Scatovivens faecipullorum]HIZ89587.1 ABC transporter permease [Candidatus Mucispirillum faecigallinarum]
MKNNLWNILKKELRELFRDKKSLAMMLVIPIFIPLLVIGMSALFESQVSKDVSEYNKIGFAYEMTEEEKNIAEEMNIEIINGNEEELKEKYDNGEINLYITKQDSKYIINTDGSDNSTFASSLMETYFNTYKQYLQQSYLQENNMNPNEVLNIITVEENVLEQDNYFADYIKNYAFLFIMMAITVSATYPATDTTAGERERGTLETLLTFPIKSRDIIVGKFLGVTVSSIITGLISLALAIISLMITKNMFSIYEGMEVMYSPITILFAVIVIIAYSFFISGLCIAIASTSKTFKEAQSALTPLTFISFFPGMIAFMMGITTTPILSIVPFLNFTLIFTDINNGTINLLNIGLMAISTIIYISLVFAHIIKQYKSEKVLFAK